MPSNIDVLAPQGEKMIEIRLRFWTNNLAKGKGRVRQKHAWTSGVVSMERNGTHGIKPKKPMPFHTLLDIPFVIEKVLLNHGIKLHPSRKANKYMEPRPKKINKTK